MTKGLVSVVLPIYNVEQYLDRCLRSIVNQTYGNLEIILVDDGSPDNCPKMCEDWAKRDSRIKVIHKENAGLGMARNTGIENANGEYICFFDSDDYIALDAIEQAYDTASKTNADIVLFGFNTVSSNGRIIKQDIPDTDKAVYSEKEIQTLLLPNLISPTLGTGIDMKLCLSAWTGMYSLALINDIKWRFVSERQYISEDVYSFLNLYRHVNKAAVLPKALYYYCENVESLSRSYRKDRFEMIKYCYNECLKLCDKMEYGSEVKERLAFQFFSNVIGALKGIVKLDIGNKEKMQALKEIISDNDLQNAVNKIELKKESVKRSVLIVSIRKRLVRTVYWLIKLKA